MGSGVAVHARGRKWQRGEGGKEMVAMGGGRAAGAPPRRRDVHGRKGCTRIMWVVPARSSLPRRDEFRCAGWLACTERRLCRMWLADALCGPWWNAFGARDALRTRPAGACVERDHDGGGGMGIRTCKPLHDETGWGMSEFTMASISPGWAVSRAY
jgi:hypothetical protein